MWLSMYLYVKVKLKFCAVFHRSEAFIALKERKCFCQHSPTQCNAALDYE